MATSTAPVNLAPVGSPTWDRICVLKPYTTNAQAKMVLGFAWDANGKTSTGGSDPVNVLVFIRGNQA